MQEVYHDGTKGKVKTAKILEELIPEIKKILDSQEVRPIKLFFPVSSYKKRR